MNLQDIITYKEYKENQDKESELNSNIKSNNKYKNIDSQREYRNISQKMPSSRTNELEVNNGDNLNIDEEKDDKNNSSNYSYTRSNKIEKEIEDNIKKENNTNNKENIQNKLNKINDKEKNNDIIDELIEKVKNKEDIRINNEIPKKTLTNLDEEIKLGLKQLDKIQTKFSKIPTSKNKINYEGNYTYKKVLFELSKTLNGQKTKLPQYKRGTYFNYKNIKILKPSIYFYTQRQKKKNYNYVKKNENKFYLSSIDGKAIIDGERKNPDDNLDNILKNIRDPFNKRRDLNDGLRNTRSYSTDRRTSYEKNKYYPDFGFRKINYYNKSYFLEELNRINSLLFS